VDSSILHKYVGRNETSELSHISEMETLDDLGAFGWLRGFRERAAMLELRKKTGNILAIPYGWIERAEFDPSEGITLYTCGKIITIRGRNLNSDIRPHIRLFQGIAQHRVLWIQESEQSASLQAAKDATVVEQIQW